MTLYFIVLAHFVLYMIPRKYHLKQEKKVFLFVTFALVFLMYGMREVTVGTDTKSYNNYFILYQNYSMKDLLFGNAWFKRLDPMFIAMSKMASLISNDTHVFLLVSGVLYALLITSFFARLQEEESYSFAYLFYSMYIICTGLNTMRQAFAIALLAHAFLSFREAKKKQALIICALAVLFHVSAILVAGVLSLYMLVGDSPKNAKRMKALSVLVIILGTLSYQYLFDRIGISEYSSSVSADVSIFNILLIGLFIVMWNLNKRGRASQYNAEEAFLETIMLSTLICCIMGGFAIGFIRMTSLQLPMLCFSFTYVFCSKKNYNISRGRAIIPIYTLIYFAHNVMANIGGIVPFVMWGGVNRTSPIIEDQKLFFKTYQYPRKGFKVRDWRVAA